MVREDGHAKRGRVGLGSKFEPPRDAKNTQTIHLLYHTKINKAPSVYTGRIILGHSRGILGAF